jgi:Arc/MetJ-type ribon-helix-helix transcriptional regulator
MAKVVSRGLRIDERMRARITEATRDGGFSSASAFMRAAIDAQLTVGRGAQHDPTERVVASLDRVARELRGVRLGQQALFTFTDTLVKTLLTCLPEPPGDAYEHAVARGKARYDRFLKSVGMGMSGNSQAALTELLRHVQED